MNIAPFKNISDQEFTSLALEKFPPTQQGLARKFKYRMTNRDIEKLHQFCGNFDGKTILAASGSSIPLLSFLSVSNPPRMIFGFDYSPKQIAYNFFLKYAIQELSFLDFRDFLGLTGKHSRSSQNKAIRRRILKKIPRQLRKYLTYNHELTRRDMKLSGYSHCRFLFEESRFNCVKRNIGRIKFFVFNLNTSFGQELNMLFPDHYFEMVYFSNVLDWICWHNTVSDVDIDSIMNMVRKVLEKDSRLIIDHLAKRKTLLPDYLKHKRVVEKSDYEMYTYYWEMYKIKL